MHTNFKIDGYTKERVFSIKLGIIALAIFAAVVFLFWLSQLGLFVLEYDTVQGDMNADGELTITDLSILAETIRNQ